jgi:hypothetical protein
MLADAVLLAGVVVDVDEDVVQPATSATAARTLAATATSRA